MNPMRLAGLLVLGMASAALAAQPSPLVSITSPADNACTNCGV